MRAENMSNLIRLSNLECRIILIRGQRVILDRDLAEMYGVETKYLNRQVKRNRARFPKEYMFQLTEKEKAEVVTICHHLPDLKYSHHLPYAFTEHGVAMLSAVLNSPRAIKVSIFIVNIFVRLREAATNNKLIRLKLDQLENMVNKHDLEIGIIFKAIKKMLTPPPEPPRRPIGFLR